MITRSVPTDQDTLIFDLCAITKKLFRRLFLRDRRADRPGQELLTLEKATRRNGCSFCWRPWLRTSLCQPRLLVVVARRRAWERQLLRNSRSATVSSCGRHESDDAKSCPECVPQPFRRAQSECRVIRLRIHLRHSAPQRQYRELKTGLLRPSPSVRESQPGDRGHRLPV